MTPSQWHNASHMLAADIVSLDDVADASEWYAIRRRPHWLGLVTTRRYHWHLKNLRRVSEASAASFPSPADPQSTRRQQPQSVGASG